MLFLKKVIAQLLKEKKKYINKNLKHCGVKASLASGSPAPAHLLHNRTNAFHFYAEQDITQCYSPFMCIFPSENQTQLT